MLNPPYIPIISQVISHGISHTKINVRKSSKEFFIPEIEQTYNIFMFYKEPSCMHDSLHPVMIASQSNQLAQQPAKSACTTASQISLHNSQPSSLHDSHPSSHDSQPVKSACTTASQISLHNSQPSSLHDSQPTSLHDSHPSSHDSQPVKSACTTASQISLHNSQPNQLAQQPAKQSA